MIPVNHLSGDAPILEQAFDVVNERTSTWTDFVDAPE